MKTIIITQEELFYLPLFMDKILGGYRNIAALVTVPMFSKSSTFFSQIMERYRLFGPRDFTIYGALFFHHKVIDLLSRYIKTNRSYSIKSIALKNSVPYYRLKNVNGTDSLRLLSSFAPEIIVSVACPQIFRKPVINLSR